MTFAAAADLYIEYRDPSDRERGWIKKLVSALGKTAVGQMTHADLVKAANALYPGRSSASKNRAALRPAASIMHYASQNGLCAWLRVPLFKEKRPATRAVTVDLAAVLIAGVDDEDKALLLLWLFRQGDRITDALNVEWEHLDLVRRVVRSYVSKTDEWITRPLHADLLGPLANAAVKKGFVFRWRTRYGVYKWLRPLCAKLKVKFTPHMARHSMATWHVEQGTDLKTIMEAGGWRDIKSVARYAAAGVERVRAAGEKLGALDGRKTRKSGGSAGEI